MRRALAVLAAVAFASLYPVPAQSLCDNDYGLEVDRVFYDGCGPNRSVVGEIITGCDGSSSSWGVQTSFEERTVVNCCTGKGRVTYWECGSQVSSLDTCIC